MTKNVLLKKEVQQVLQQVTDPEMPYISIVELGMLENIAMKRDGFVQVELLPTFSGCPALNMIQADVKEKVKERLLEWNDDLEVEVTFRFHPPWTTDRITETGKEKLRQNGVSPPPASFTAGEPWKIPCPYCHSMYTTMENIFGPTACRSILYCNACKNPFEAMKPIANLFEGVENKWLN
ncbi:1,2-phenylacetyl-CoA epoxidase subunit PaaD [Virgibacillus sp. Bac330]|uniref:1,2-phenylacetyl-CoA epoxidase subunit PaaD n=1 Tax=Virgibacillus sp. Bac330 TaxID=2419841 RepID=UPI000EF55513|nr:1,2-phenylacetyl-CoA epoxidase subunit PaaD [Virgibacillus sp. Bac330]